MLRALHSIGRGIKRGFSLLQPVVEPIVRILVRWLLLPLYRFIVLTRLRVARWMVSARGFVFLIFTNRYVFHAVLIVISLVTIGSQVQARYATASEVGQHSLLYGLVSDPSEQAIEEPANPTTLTKNTSYLGSDTVTASTSIDDDSDNQVIADLTIPGSIDATTDLGDSTALADNASSTPDTSAPNTSEVAVERTQTDTYTVQTGDTVASIAKHFGVNVATIIWANNLTDKALIKPGITLKVPAASGVLLTIKSGDTLASLAKKYNIDADAISQANHLGSHQSLAIGDELLIPGGTPLASAAKPTQTIVAVRPDVPKTTIKDKSYDIYQEGDTPVDDTRTKPPDLPPPPPAADTSDSGTSAASTKLLWPTRLHVINQYYGWKHTGVDIDGDYTDPIYAAADGVVEKAGWNNGGYGLMILIDHPNGLKTRYGHASKMFVSAGDTVKRGQVIAMVGTTGRSTGTHLHFEVYSGTTRENPLAYIR